MNSAAFRTGERLALSQCAGRRRVQVATVDDHEVALLDPVEQGR